MISCSNLYQDFTTTTVEFTKESIASIKSRTSGDDVNCVIFATITCGKRTQTKTVDIADIQDANGVTLQFDKLPVGKTGTLYVSVGRKKVKGELETYYSENIAVLDEKTQFRVQPNGNTKIKVSLKENEERFFADFLIFPYDNIPISNIGLDFTEYSTITAPLPVGTTRWQINHNDNGNITYLGSFGEKIDVAKELMQYKEYFITSEPGKNTVFFEATGNPMNQIKTPIVYCEADPNTETEVYYTFKILGSNTSVLTTSDKITDYCFDNAGNLYFIRGEGASKLPYDFNTNSYKSGSIPLYGGNYPAQSISYDKAQNALYLLRQNDGTFSLAKFSNPAGTIYKTTSADYKTFSLSIEGAEPNSQSWTAHNGKIYVASVHKNENGSPYKLVLQEYKEEAYTWTSVEADKIYTIDVNNTNLNFTTDIMYQDGSLYVIFRCYNTGWNTSSNYSTGGILKYDISSQNFDHNFGIKGFATENSKRINSPSNPSIRFYAPTSGETENKYFYGPTKFVAIMPKKLVFLDQGASIDDYDYEQYNTNIPTKTRIVEYDLTSNCFSSKEITSSDLEFILAITL